MRVVLFGATGMVGAGVLRECLVEPSVVAVLVVGRRTCGVTHAKLRELLRRDFFDYSDVSADLAFHDACFFCLGVSAAGMNEADYYRLTYALTMATAKAVSTQSPHVTFCYVSGEGTDSTEAGRLMWARVKGKTENSLLAMPLNAFMFRPGYIQPLKGVRSPRRRYRALHAVLGPLYPLMRRFLPTHVTTTENVGRAMIRAARDGYSKPLLENPDINALAASSLSAEL